LMMPGQLGPIKRVLFDKFRACLTLTISCDSKHDCLTNSKLGGGFVGDMQTGLHFLRKLEWTHAANIMSRQGMHVHAVHRR
jgi:hypothetical protein